MLSLLAAALVAFPAAPQDCTFVEGPGLGSANTTTRSIAVGTDTLFVGYSFAPNAAGQSNRGRVKVLSLAPDGELASTGWIEHPLSPPSYRFFGRAITAAGDRMVVTCPDDLQLIGVAGMAYAYTRAPTGEWVFEDRVFAPWGTFGTRFGNSAAMDGDWLFIGELDPFSSSPILGRVHVYRRVGTQWNQTQVLTGTTSVFGHSVDVDGGRLVVGASRGVDTTSDGGAFIYEESGGVWTQTASLSEIPGSIGGQFFGQDVAIEGDIAVIAASGYRSGPGGRGAVGVFKQGTSGQWDLVETLRQRAGTAGTSDDAFGKFVDLEGGLIAVGRAAVGLGPTDIPYGIEVYGAVCDDWQRGRLWGAPSSGLPTAALTQDIVLDGSRVITAYPSLVVSREMHCTLGAAECAPNMQNATGRTAVLRALGSPLISDDDLRLRVEALPTGSPGIMLLSDTMTVSPFGGCTSLLCLGGSIARASTVPLVANAQGRVLYPFDLQGLPPLFGGGPVDAGETWYFQYWYRNPSTAKPSGLSSAVAVTFE